jgi:hypothetical protein
MAPGEMSGEPYLEHSRITLQRLDSVPGVGDALDANSSSAVHQRLTR